MIQAQFVHEQGKICILKHPKSLFNAWLTKKGKGFGLG